MRFNPTLAQIDDTKNSEVEMDIGIMDGMSAAADEALRTLPVASISRWVDETFFDSSEKMTGQQANELFKLEGEYAFKPDQETTYDTAVAKSQDLARITKNELIQNIVNEDSPVLGRVTQFAASIGAGFADPAMAAINLATGMGVASAVGRIAQSTRVLNGVARVSPMGAKVLSSAYDTAATKTVMTIMAREGAENFVGSLAEESINFAGIGSERLARKVTTEESMFNIFAGTVLGAGLGTAISSEGRSAIARSISRRFGDNAGEIVSAKVQMKDLNQKMGTDSNIVNETFDADKFDPKPWHTEVTPVDAAKIEADYANPRDAKMYVTLDEDGAMVNYSSRGSGIVTTNNMAHALNSGQRAVEIDPSQLNIMDGAKFIEQKPVAIDLAMDRAFNQNLGRKGMQDALKRIDPEYSILNAQNKVKSDLEVYQEFKDNVLDGVEFNSMDDVADFLDGVSNLVGKDLKSNQVIDGIVRDLGFDSYSFVGKGASDQGRYAGLYVTPDGQAKLVKGQEVVTPPPTPKQRQEYDEQLKQRMENYHDEFSKKQQDVKAKTNPLPDKNIKLSSGEGSDDTFVWNDVTKVNPVMQKSIKSELDRLSLIPDKTQDELVRMKALDAVYNNKKIDDLVEADTLKLSNFAECIIKGLAS